MKYKIFLIWKRKGKGRRRCHLVKDYNNLKTYFPKKGGEKTICYVSNLYLRYMISLKFVELCVHNVILSEQNIYRL